MFPTVLIHGREAGAGGGAMPRAVSDARPLDTSGPPAPVAPDLPLLAWALDLLLEAGPRRPPSWLRGPLVVVTGAPAFPALRGRTIHRGGSDVGITVWAGARLGQAIGRRLREGSVSDLLPRLTASPLCLVEGVDEIGRADTQLGLAQLIDEADTRGTTFGVSLARHPAAAGFVPQLASRLCGGLLVRGPTTVLPPSAAAGRPAPSLRRILNAVARQRELTAAELVGPSRCRTVVEARGIAMYLARGLTGSSLYEIGHACGGRDHTTVLHGVRVIERRIARDPAFAADLARLAADLGGAPACRDGVGSGSGTTGAAGRHRRRRAPGGHPAAPPPDRRRQP
jgi:hypothetical protein